MTLAFMICATLGGTVLVCQFVMTLVGLGGHGFADMDMPSDIGHGFGGDFHAGADGIHGGAGDHHGGGDSADADQMAHHGTMWLFGVLSFRTVTAALTFFGLAGLAAQEAGASGLIALVAAVASGLAAMFAVYWIMRTLYRLQADGGVRIERSVGRHGDVYLRIPGNRSGVGKIQLNLQNRTMEYSAVTAGAEIPTGAKIVVVGVVNPTTLDVQRE